MAKLLVFNWKMNPSSLKEALVLAKSSDSKNAVVAPPFPFLEKVGKVLKKSGLGAQDLFWEEGGAFTGEVAASELKSVGVKYVIVGHSERRHKLGETDAIVARKLKAALDSGLTPILCVGETAAEHKAKKTKEVLKKQLEKGLSLVPGVKRQASSILVAYEPVWAIGTGNPETPESAKETIKFIKRQASGVKCHVLYGGSVNSKNLKSYLQYKEIDGALVGGASLNKKEVMKIILATSD